MKTAQPVKAHERQHAPEQRIDQGRGWDQPGRRRDEGQTTQRLDHFGYPLIVLFYRGFFCPRDSEALPAEAGSPTAFAISSISKRTGS